MTRQIIQHADGRHLLATAGVCVLAACGGQVSATVPAHSVRGTAPSPGPALSIQGNRFVDSAGATTRLLGVNRAGTEYACVQGWGIFDGPSDAQSISAIAAWHVNAVRLPLNEDCWLGINGLKPEYSGGAYRLAVQRYVSALHAAALSAILDLHWAAPGADPAVRQLPMPDADHASEFWSSVASTFKADERVVFDIFNEPFAGDSNAATTDAWGCWLHGCAIKAGYGISHSWQAAGMQSLVDAVRGAGARQPIIAGGLSWSSDLTGWLSHRPRDPDRNLAASFHEYNFGGCNSAACWNAQVSPVAAQVPVVTGELGENDCQGGFVEGYMQWADHHGLSYLGWTWDTWDCSGGPALITAYTGAPTPFGAAFEAHLASLPGTGQTGQPPLSPR